MYLFIETRNTFFRAFSFDLSLIIYNKYKFYLFSSFETHNETTTKQKKLRLLDRDL